jgi:hypothetical protein
MKIQSFFLAICFSLAGLGKTDAQLNQPLLSGVDHISVSRQGNIFAALTKGDVVMLDSSGKIVQRFSPRKPARIHLLEAWNGLRVLAFSRDFQSYFLLDRFLLSDGPVSLENDNGGYIRLLAPSQDGNLWVFDESTFQLKKINPTNGNTIFSTPLDLVLSGKPHELSFMREYQNQLYIADKLGQILVFDQTGTFRKKLPLENCSWFGFEGEELLMVQKGEVIHYHPFRLELRKEPLPEGLKDASELILLNGRFWALVKGELVIY